MAIYQISNTQTLISIKPPLFSSAFLSLLERLHDDRQITNRYGVLDQAMTAGLVETMTGVAGIGAFADSLQDKWREYFEKSLTDPKAKPPADERVLFFLELLKRAQGNDAPYGPLVLTQDDIADLKRLNEFRGNLIHIKPSGWSLETAGLPRILGVVAEAMQQMFAMTPLQIHLEPDEIQRAHNAIKVIRDVRANEQNS
jgi:hypothetical protein